MRIQEALARNILQTSHGNMLNRDGMTAFVSLVQVFIKDMPNYIGTGATSHASRAEAPKDKNVFLSASHTLNVNHHRYSTTEEFERRALDQLAEKFAKEIYSTVDDKYFDKAIYRIQVISVKVSSALRLPGVFSVEGSMHLWLYWRNKKLIVPGRLIAFEE